MKKNWQKFVLTLFTFIMPVISLAQITIIPTDPNAQGKIINPIPNVTSIPGLIHTILVGVLKIGIPIVVLAIVYCGFLFVFARGNPEELKKAKSALLYTVIGAAVLLGSWAIAEMISATVLAL